MTALGWNNLAICCECFELRGPVSRGPGGIVQLCGCATSEEKEAQPKWGDFNTFFELCYCCGLELVSSGSRFSPFFCEWCRERVIDLNDSVGACVIPLGRHSVMNRVSLKAERVKDELELRRFTRRLQSFFGLVGDMYAYAPTVVEHNLDALGFPPNAREVPLTAYFSALKRSDLSKEEAFKRLVAFARGET